MSHAATATSPREQEQERKSSTHSSHRRTASSPPPPVPPLPPTPLTTPQAARSLHRHHHSLSSLRFGQSLSEDPVSSPSPSPRPDWAGSAIKRLRRERHVKSTLARVEALDNNNENSGDHRDAENGSPSTEDSAYETADDGSSQWLAQKISTRDLGRRGSGRVKEKEKEKERLLRARASAPDMAAQRWRERDRGAGQGADETEEDLFTQVGNEGPRSQSRVSVLASRQAKRQSLPGDPRVGDVGRQRPKSSGTVLEASSSSRMQEFPSELSRHADRFRDSRFSSAGSVVSGAGREDGGGSVVGRSVSGRTTQRHTSFGLRERLASPEVPHYGRRRPSFGAVSQQQQQSRHQVQHGARHHSGQSDLPSPAGDSDPKPRSDSVDSNTSSSGVWDELDDLKSRIKKLEFSGSKMHPTPGAAVSGGSSERPRTATTAPTTIDSSPKADRKPSNKVPAADTTPSDTAVGGPGLSKIHPNLHSALAKAKTLLTLALYRSLENTAADALQLAALTSSAGPQGTTFSAASIINGVTVSDRHVRRKADNMCRNLTDLCLALCDGKNDAPTPNGVVASPMQLDTPTIRATPPSRLGSARYSLSATGGPGSNDRSGGSRPMSRLEARRSSILGPGSLPNSPRDYVADEGTPSGHPRSAVPNHMYDNSARRSSAGSTTAGGSGLRASSSLLRNRLSAARSHRQADDAYTEAGAEAGEEEGEDDPTIRAPSRAMTDLGGLRSSKRQSLLSHKRSDTAIDENGNGGGFPQRSPSLRSTFSNRKASNLAAHDANARVSSASYGSGFAERRRSQLQQQQQGMEGSLPPPPPVVAEEDERSADEADARYGGEREDGVEELGMGGYGTGNGKGKSREDSRSRRRIASLGPFGTGAGGRRVGSLT